MQKKKNGLGRGPGGTQITQKNTSDSIEKTHKFPTRLLRMTLPEGLPTTPFKTQLLMVKPAQY